MKITWQGYGAKLYLKFMLNRLKVTSRELILFICVTRPNSRKIFTNI